MGRKKEHKRTLSAGQKEETESREDDLAEKPKELPVSRFYHPIPLDSNSSSSRNITYQVLDKTQLKDLAQQPARDGVGLLAANQPPLDRKRKVRHPPCQLRQHPQQKQPLQHLEDLCLLWAGVWP